MACGETIGLCDLGKPLSPLFFTLNMQSYLNHLKKKPKSLFETLVLNIWKLEFVLFVCKCAFHTCVGIGVSFEFVELWNFETLRFRNFETLEL